MFAISLENTIFSQKKTKLEMLYFSDKVRENDTSGSWRFKLYKYSVKNVLYFPLNNNNVSMHIKFHKNALTCHVECTIWLLHGSISNIYQKQFLKIPFL
jgi:hypothetical protein